MSIDAFDLDGTLAERVKDYKPDEVGAPIPRMVQKVRELLSSGKKVIIFTASVGSSNEEYNKARRTAIEKFCKDNFGQVLPVTNVKSHDITRFWDDRAIPVVRNKGKIGITPGLLAEDDHPAVEYVTRYGYVVAIENPTGSKREWTDEDGNAQYSVMKCPYGRIIEDKNGDPTEDNDGDQIDAFIGSFPEKDAPDIFVINQAKKDDPEEFDEHKVVFGVKTVNEARDLYLSNYQEGWRCGSIVQMTLPQFDKWVEEGDKKMPVITAPAVSNTNDSATGVRTGDPILDAIVTAYDRNWPAAERHALPRWQFGDPDKEAFPIKSSEDLGNSASLLHHSSNPGRVKRRLISIAKRLGLSLPESWKNEADTAYAPTSYLTEPTSARVLPLQPVSALGNPDPPQIHGTLNTFYCTLCNKTFDADVDDLVCPCPDCLMDADRIFHTYVGNLRPRARGDSTITDDSFFPEEDVLICTDCAEEYTLITDGLEPGVLLKVRHIATIADAINGNDRLYPRKVLLDSIRKLRSKIQSGYRPYSEYRHPVSVRVGGEDHYVTNEDKKSARIDDVEDPTPDGRVYITRSILNTPHGRLVNAAYRSGTHKGVSNRWKMKGHYADINRRKIHVADDLDWHTTDDVDNPAFPETRSGYHLLTDEMRAELKLPASKPTSTKESKVNERFRAAKDSLYKILSRAAIDNRRMTKQEVRAVAEHRLAMSDEIRLSERAGEAVDDMTGELLKTDAAIKMAGVSIPPAEGGRPGPTGWIASQTGSPNNPGYAPDMEASATSPDLRVGAVDPDDDSGSQGTPRVAHKDGKKSKKDKKDGKGGNPFAQATKENPGPENMPAGDSEAAKKAKADAKEAKRKAMADSVLAGMGLTPDGLEALRNQTNTAAKAAADEKRKTAVKAVIDSLAGDVFAGVDEQMANLIRDFVLASAQDADEGQIRTTMLAQKDALMGFAAKNRLAGGGYDGGTSLRGGTVNDPGAPGGNGMGSRAGYGLPRLTTGNGQNASSSTTSESRGPAYMSKVDALLAEHDRYAMMLGHRLNANSTETRRRREYNREHFINPLLTAIDEARKKSDTAAQWATAMDSAGSDEDVCLADAIGHAQAAPDSQTSLNNVFNQPVILTALIIEQFQDMQSLQFVQGIGPGLSAGPNDMGWSWAGQFPDGRFGAQIRVPVETYTLPGGTGPGYSVPPANYGSLYGNQTDFGLLYPENHGIDPGTPNVVWLTFNAAFRRIAADISKDVIIQMGSGPLNWAAISRALFHITWDKSRRIDTANLNEMLLASDEYGMVTGQETPNLTFNSVYGAGGNLTVNLNPTKAANAAPSTTDPHLTFGNAVVAIIRVQSQASPVTAASSIYAGTIFGTSPIVRPRTKTVLSEIGQVSQVVLHPVTVQAPVVSAGQLEGFIYPVDGNIYNTPAQNDNATNATFAVDYENGLILFKSTSGVGGSSNVVTTPVTYTYSYATNFTNFIVNNVQALGLVPVGQNIQDYFNNIFLVFDQQAALMGSAPRYVKPDIAFMSLNAAPTITTASIFYKFNSPDGTGLFPTEDFFFQRTGIMGARINAPWWGGDRRIWLGRGGTTKYAINTPFEISGPYPKYDTQGRIVPGQLFYGEELSAQFTPMSVQQDGITILNPVSSTIILR